MKIVHLVLNYHPSIGGTQILFKGISENLVYNYQDEIEVLTVDSYYGPHSNLYKKITPQKEVINGVLVRRFSFFRKYRFWLALLHKIVIKLTGRTVPLFERYNIGPWSPSLTKAINCTKADVISASSSTFLYMDYPLYRHKLTNPKPFVFQGAIHFSPNDHDNVVAPRTLKAIISSEYYISNTHYEKDRLVNLGVPAEMIVVTGTAVNMNELQKGNRAAFRTKFQLGDNDILIGYIGRLEATKSIDILVAAFVKAYLINSNLCLVIAGFESNYAIQLQQYVYSLQPEIAKRIFIELNISNASKINLYHALDIFVLPSVNESFGIVFLEAWSCKKPVIGAAIGAIKSVISNGIDGLLMEPFDAVSLCNQILTLATNTHLRITLGENGYNKTANNYTWDIVAKKYRDTYLLAIEKFKQKKLKPNFQ